MKIFLSHTNRDKPLVNIIRRQLPSHIKQWIDEEELLWGQDLTKVISDAISKQADYVVIFLSNESINSEWVKKELQIALEYEKEINRTFVLPILLDNTVWNQIEPQSFQSRRYLEIKDFSEQGVSAFSKKISDELFAWLSINLDNENKDKIEAKKEMENIIGSLKEINKAVDDFNEVADEWALELLTSLKYKKSNQAISLVEDILEDELPERQKTLQSYKNNLEKMAQRQEEAKSMALGLTMMGLSLNMPQQEKIINCLKRMKYLYTFYKSGKNNLSEGELIDQWIIVINKKFSKGPNKAL